MHFTLATNGQFGGAQRPLKVAESRTLIYRFWPVRALGGRYCPPSARLDPLPTSANCGNVEMKECHKPTKTAHVDCENDFFLSFDCSVGAIHLWADFSVQSKTKIGNRAVNLCSR
jgi:hypothetical protein